MYIYIYIYMYKMHTHTYMYTKPLTMEPADAPAMMRGRKPFRCRAFRYVSSYYYITIVFVNVIQWYYH